MTQQHSTLHPIPILFPFPVTSCMYVCVTSCMYACMHAYIHSKLMGFRIIILRPLEPPHGIYCLLPLAQGINPIRPCGHDKILAQSSLKHTPHAELFILHIYCQSLHIYIYTMSCVISVPSQTIYIWRLYEGMLHAMGRSLGRKSSSHYAHPLAALLGAVTLYQVPHATQQYLTRCVGHAGWDAVPEVDELGRCPCLKWMTQSPIITLT